MQYDMPSIIVEFMKDGELHKSIRMSSCAKIIEQFKTDKDYLEAMKRDYEKLGAEIVAVYAIETSQIAIDEIDSLKLFVAKTRDTWNGFLPKLAVALCLFTLVNGFLMAHLLSRHHDIVVRLLGGQ